MGLAERLLGALRSPLDVVPQPVQQVAQTLPVLGAFFTPQTKLLMRYGLGPLLQKDQALGRDFAGGLVQDVLTPIGLPLQERFAPNTDLTATMRQIDALPNQHPGEAIDLLRHSRDSGAAWLGGGLEMASDPLNVALPAASQTLRGMELLRLANALDLVNDPAGTTVRQLRARLLFQQLADAAGSIPEPPLHVPNAPGLAGGAPEPPPVTPPGALVGPEARLALLRLREPGLNATSVMPSTPLTPPAPAALPLDPAGGAGGTQVSAGVGLPGGLQTRLGAAGVGALTGAGNAQAYNLLYRDEQGQPLSPEEQHRNLLLATLGGAAGGAALGPRLYENRNALGQLAQVGIGLGPDVFPRRDWGRDLPKVDEAKLLSFVRPELRANFDIGRLQREGLDNLPAQRFNNEIEQNWQKARQGALTPDDIARAYITTLASMGRAGLPWESALGPQSRLNLLARYPELENRFADAVVRRAETVAPGGTMPADVAQKVSNTRIVRPEDVAAIVLRHTPEGQALVDALVAGDAEATRQAARAFNTVFPFSGLSEGKGYAIENIAAAAAGGKMQALADEVNRVASSGAAPGVVVDQLRSGALKMPGIAGSKAGFIVTLLGGGKDAVTVDSNVRNWLGNITPERYTEFLRALYPQDITDATRHHLFWDSAAGAGYQFDQKTGAVKKVGDLPGYTTGHGGMLQGLLGDPPPPRVPTAPVMNTTELRDFRVNPDQIRGDQQIVGFPRNRTDLGGTFAHPYDLQNMLDEGTTQLERGVPLPLRQQYLNAGLNPAALRNAASTVTNAVTNAVSSIVTPGSTWESLGREAARNARTEQSAANALSLSQAPVPTSLRDWLSLWKRQVVETPRNWLQDESWGRVVLRALQPGGTQALNSLRQDAARYLTGTNAWQKLPVATRGILNDIGKLFYVPKLGESLDQELRHGKQLSTVQQATGGAALSLLNPVGVATNALGVATAGAAGAARPALSAIFRTINDFQHSTFRLAAFNDELTNLVAGGAGDFLARLTRQGINVSSLPTSGGFSPAQVGQLAGPTAERQWAAIINRAVTLAEQRVKFLFGDYAQKNIVESALGGAVPFLSWVTRAYPVAVRMALDHPVVALAVYQYFRATSQGAGKDGRPGYTTGMVPIPTKTPFVGPVLAALVPGQQGVVYVDPVGAFSPVGADTFFGGTDEITNPDKTWYQRAAALLSRLGLPGPNPLIQAGAYVTGLDYKSPGALSRTAGLEQGLALVPGNPQLPNVGANLLSGARAKVSPAIGPALGGKADPYAAAYDPISRRYGELVYERTGHTLQDPMNRAYLVAMTDPENPLLQQARQDVLLSGAVKNAASLVNPTQLVAQGQTPLDYQAARGRVPFSADQIGGAVPALAAAMQDANTHYQQNTPVMDVYQGTKPYQRADILQTQWADQPDVKYLQRVAPRSYATQKKVQQLELWVYDHRALQRSNPTEYQRQYQQQLKALGLD